MELLVNLLLHMFYISIISNINYLLLIFKLNLYYLFNLNEVLFLYESVGTKTPVQLIEQFLLCK